MGTIYEMSVQSGRSKRPLFNPVVTFNKLLAQQVLKPKVTRKFKQYALFSLVGIIIGTIFSIMGILKEQKSLIIIGVLEMCCIIIWLLCNYS